MEARSLLLAGLLAWATAAGAQDGRSWSISASHEVDASQTVLGQEHAAQRQTIAVRRAFDANTHALGQHEYRILDLPVVDGRAADTNGHVHRLTAGWRRDTAPWHLRLGAVLAVSSNVLKHLGEIEPGDFVPDVAIDRDVGAGVRVGLRADDRFGRTLVYPGVAWHIQPTPAHEIVLGLPESAWRWNLTPRLATILAAGPDGATWHVRNRELTRRSEVQVRSWRAGVTLRWQPLQALAVEASAGRRFAGELRYVLRDGATAHVDVADANVFGVALAATF